VRMLSKLLCMHKFIFGFAILLLCSNVHSDRKMRFFGTQTLTTSSATNAYCRLSIQNVGDRDQTIYLKDAGMFGPNSGTTAATREMEFKQAFDAYSCTPSICQWTPPPTTGSAPAIVKLQPGAIAHLQVIRLSVAFDNLTCQGILEIKDDRGAVVAVGNARLVTGDDLRDATIYVNGGRPF